jgi:hypothetical protein
VDGGVEFGEGLGPVFAEDVAADLSEGAAVEPDRVLDGGWEGVGVGFGAAAAVVPASGPEAFAYCEGGVDGVAAAVHEARGFGGEFVELLVGLVVEGFELGAFGRVDGAA